MMYSPGDPDSWYGPSLTLPFQILQSSFSPFPFLCQLCPPKHFLPMIYSDHTVLVLRSAIFTTLPVCHSSIQFHSPVAAYLHESFLLLTPPLEDSAIWCKPSYVFPADPFSLPFYSIFIPLCGSSITTNTFYQ